MLKEAVNIWVKVKVKSLSPPLCDPTDCSLSGSSVHGIFQARVLEWIAISFSRGSSQPRNWTWVSRIAGRLFTIWATREAPDWNISIYLSKFVVVVIWNLYAIKTIQQNFYFIYCHFQFYDFYSVYYCSLWIYDNIFICSSEKNFSSFLNMFIIASLN